MGETTVVMVSHPNRGEMRAQTLRLFAERATAPAPPIHVWTGEGKDEIADIRALHASPLFAGGGDVLWLEDDLEPCVNALPYMASFAGPALTSFYNPGGTRRYGLNEGFVFSQALKIPAALVARIRTEPFPPAPPKQLHDASDCVIDRYLKRWGQKFFQHRSVVQHVGEVSTWTTSTLRAPGRRSVDWPGPTVDALTFRWH